MSVSRLIRVEDASVLADLYRTGRDFLAPWMPVRAGSYLTAEGQRRSIEEALTLHGQGTLVPYVILDGGEVVGRVTLSSLTRASFQSCNLGYWVSETHNGQGLATAAVGAMMRLAFGELGVHRIEAGALPDNLRSQAVLERNGFVRFGLAQSYLHVAGAWRDHLLYQALAEPAPAPACARAATAGGRTTPAGAGATPPAAVVDAFYATQRRLYAGEAVEEELARFLATDVIWHVPGRNAIAGHYRGRAEVLTYFRRRRDLARRSFVVTPRGTLGDGSRVVHLADGEAVLGDQRRRWRTVGIFELAEGRIAECWLVPFDQHAFDEIWAESS
ncbi:MAG TPA: GNAT family N-acetyltransferase [Solirubrobacteraceae bacterium]